MIKGEKDIAFKNNAPFKSCIPNNNNILIDKVENVYIAMPMYNLLEYHYSMTSGSLSNFKKTKSMILMPMIVLQMVNHLSIKQK